MIHAHMLAEFAKELNRESLCWKKQNVAHSPVRIREESRNWDFRDKEENVLKNAKFFGASQTMMEH